MSEPVPVVVPLEIRWRDLDALGHVNNAVYLTYFEHARMGYIRTLLGQVERDPRTLLPRDFQFILAEVTCQFRAPATLGDRLAAEIYVKQVGRKSFVFAYRIVDQNTGRLMAEGCTTQVCYDYARRESRPVPDDIVEKMEALQQAPIPRVF